MSDHLPVGFRFYPTEEELVSFYLHNKLKGTRPDLDEVIPVVNIYDYDPWDLPQFAGERGPTDSKQWFFFTERQEREARGGRPNRLTKSGYWKATGSPGEVYSSQKQIIGRKKTRVFYKGRAPNGSKTCWKMNEYKILESADHEASSSAGGNLQEREELSLCRVYYRSSCLTAIDQRLPLPQAVAAGDQGAILHHQQRQYAEATTSDNQQNPADITSSTSDSLFTNPSQLVGSGNNYHRPTDGEPLWDWEENNWYNM